MKKTLLAVALLAGFAGTANASDMSYNFVEVNYVDAGNAFDAPSVVNFDGYSIRGSVALGDKFYLIGGYTAVSDDPFGTSLDFDTYDVGVGFRHGISDKADFFGDVSYNHTNVDTFGFSDSDSGYGVRLGVRGEMGSKFEGTIGVSHRDFGDYGNTTALLLGGHLKFTENFGMVASVEAGDDTVWTVGVRGSF